MNIIPVGWNCFNAMGLTKVGLRKQSLPFDYLRSPLPSTVSVLKRLKSPDFNMQTLLKEMFSVRSCDTVNIHGFDVSHFHLKHWKGWCSKDVSECIDAKTDSRITTEERLKCELMYKYDDVYSLTAHPKVYEIFERRFNRLKDMFFTQENILVYNDIKLNNRWSSEWVQYIPELISLNPLNRLIYITYADRQVLLPPNDNIEIHRLDIGDYLDQKVKVFDKIKCIFTGVN